MPLGPFVSRAACSRGLSVSEAAPFARHGREFLSAVQLDVLDGVTETQLVNASASNNIAVHLNNGQSID